MRKFIAALALISLIAIPSLTATANAAPVSPSSPAFGSNGYARCRGRRAFLPAAQDLAFALAVGLHPRVGRPHAVRSIAPRRDFTRRDAGCRAHPWRGWMCE